jgi:hypothetical protein
MLNMLSIYKKITYLTFHINSSGVIIYYYLLKWRGDMKKDAMVGVRLSGEEVEKLDVHCQGQLSRAQVIRVVIQDFLVKNEKEQRAFLVKRLFESGGGVS